MSIIHDHRGFTKPVHILLLVLFLLPLFTATDIYAFEPHFQCTISVKKLGSIIVLESGRKKPLDTYARNKLLQFSGKRTLKGSSAIQWLSRTIFNHTRADNDLIFLINNPEIADALGISPRTKRRYSFAELFPAWEKITEYAQKAGREETSNRSPFDREIIQTYRNIQEYQEIRSAFSFLSPNPFLSISDSSLQATLGFSPNHFPSFYELLSHSRLIADRMKMIHKKGMDSLSSDEYAIVKLARNMFRLEQSVNNPPPHIIPIHVDNREQWLGPWEYLAKFKASAIHKKPIELLLKIRESYLTNSQHTFDRYISEYNQMIAESLPQDIALPNPTLETAYNRVNPLFWSKVFYGIAALLSLITVSSLSRKTYPVSIVLIFIGYLLHTAAIIARMIIMAHPPVTNLYETFIFTAWATVILGMVLERMRVRPVGLVTASVTGFIFLHIASRYARDGDTLGMLSAILDSSFWLTTHIVTIALGYAGYVAAGFLGHLYIIRAIAGRDNKSSTDPISRSVYGAFAFGFLFTIVGTVFGGMWADQAWGRFWGWDPKENGALLIILWGLIVLHSRAAGIIHKTGTAAGAAVGTMLVMCTWIGVNLLGIGLHSYGFTSAGALHLFLYISVEVIFLIVTGSILFFRNRKKAGLHEKSV